MRPIITLTTDFGIGSTYVAQMKGVMLGICSKATIVDITHAVPAQNILAGAIALRDASMQFPEGTIHIGVVDPGVGTARQLIYLESAGQRYVGPDNGLFSLVTREHGITRLVALTNREHWGAHISSTFHGRDIMAPVAARLALGLDPRLLGKERMELVALPWPEPQSTSEALCGEIVYFDSFGNAVSNVHRRDVAASNARDAALHIHIGAHLVRGLSATYGSHPPGEVVALYGSGDYLEIAVVNGSAQAKLGLQIGDRITLRRA